MIQTLTKKINIKNIKGNFNFAHEHINFDLTAVRNDEDSKSENITNTIKELTIAKKQGLGLIVDLSNYSMKSDKNKVLQVSQLLDIPIVTATGFYMNKYETQNMMSVEKIAKLFINDIQDGFKNTSIKAGIIGEIGTSSKKIYPFEKNVFQAAVIAQKATGVAIYTHVDLGQNALEQVNLLLKHGANPGKVIIGHVDFLSMQEIETMLNLGFNVGVDTIGKNKYLDDGKRLEIILQLIKKGWEDKIVMSLDISKKSYLKAHGGHGYGFLYNDFLTKLKQKISQEQIKKISFTNILKIIDIKENHVY